MQGGTISPSKRTLMIFEAKRKSAEHGHKLLKQKRDLLKKIFMTVKKKLVLAKQNMGVDFSRAYVSLAEAQIAAGNITARVLNTIKPNS